MEESPQNIDTEKMIVPVVKTEHIDPKFLAGTVVLVIMALSFVFVMLSRLNTTPGNPIAPVMVPEMAETGPVRQESGAAAPASFPQDIAILDGAPISEGYSIPYPEGEQSTVVFASEKSVTEAYAYYLAAIMKDAWIIVNQNPGENIASLYGMKGNRELNVTISQNDQGQTAVTISAFTK